MMPHGSRFSTQQRPASLHRLARLYNNLKDLSPFEHSRGIVRLLYCSLAYLCLHGKNVVT